MTVDIDYLHDHLSDPDVRAVLEDWERSRYDRREYYTGNPWCLGGCA